MLTIYIRDIDLMEKEDQTNVYNLIFITNPYFFTDHNTDSTFGGIKNVVKVVYEDNSIGNIVAAILRLICFNTNQYTNQGFDLETQVTDLRIYTVDS